MAIILCSEGGAGEVTGSKHVLTVDGTRLLVDCGAFQGRRKEAEEKNRALLPDPSSVAAMVLTHAHYDHCGMLPLLVKRGYRGSVYCTSATRDLANLVMMDSARIQERDAEFLARQAEKRGEKFDWKPLYDEEDVFRAVGQCLPLEYHRQKNILPTISVELLDAGHILGSSLLRVKARDASGNDITIGFSGDLGRKNKPIIRDPESMSDIDYLVLESTYGDRLHESTEGAMQRLAQIVRETMARGGKLIIPAFAVERTQELIFNLHLLLDQHEIPAVPIWVDSPMAVDATSIFKAHPECYDKETYELFTQHAENPFGFSSLHFSRTVEESKRLNSADGPMIIISADGMCEAGRIQHHLAHTISNPRNTVLVIGYMAENTLGRRIRDGAKEVRIHGDFYPVHAQIEEIAAFSAHADYAETIDWLKGTDLARLREVFLVHGETKALTALRGHVLDFGVKKVTIVEPQKGYTL